MIEEIGEVLKAFGKWDRFGSGSRHPNGGMTNAEEALFELEDLKGAIDVYLPDVRAIVHRDAAMAASNDNAKKS
ncbi:hypothetical protein [Bradyrhizobium ottawaense]|uniref:hypothetical protein n=1 Tax=Bradyrhizobium ottawaense TaxID=931866 RepID=UPI000B8410B5|nr:hypothetical protein [Bradyrhizobium ottawaense]